MEELFFIADSGPQQPSVDAEPLLYSAIIAQYYTAIYPNLHTNGIYGFHGVWPNDSV